MSGTAQFHSQHDVQGLSIRGKQSNFLFHLLKTIEAFGSAEQLIPIFLSEHCQCPFFIVPDSATIFDKDCRSTKLADVSSLREFFPLNISASIKCNIPLLSPARLITQRENLL